jgi:pyruvate dehydrogenase E2 component (dihydrolipoamide acetyltransferase)
MADVIEMIQLSPTMEEGRIVAWRRNEGDTVKTGDIIAEVETDKAAMDMESFFDGTLLKIVAKAGDSVKVGAILAIIGKPGEDITALLSSTAPAAQQPTAAAPAGVSTPAASAPPPVGNGDRVLSSPLARKIADEAGLDVRSVTGSGPAGRVVRRDVEAALAAPTSAPAPRAAAPAPVVAPVVLSADGLPPARMVELSPMRKAIARNLAAAWQAPAFMLTRELDVDVLVAARESVNAALAKTEGAKKLSINDFVIKAVALALRDVPEMNSAFLGDRIALFDSADIGIAVALDGGLITPIIRSAHTKSVGQIAREAAELAGRAREKKLKPEEYTGSTFSISNLGMFGIDHFTAVLNPPAAGILAVGTVKKQPVVDGSGNVAVGSRMTVTLTCDHRAVDGAVGAKFLQRLAIYLEQPLMMVV